MIVTWMWNEIEWVGRSILLVHFSGAEVIDSLCIGTNKGLSYEYERNT